MSTITVREMQPEDEYFVSTCSHVGESDEIDACGRRRLAWLKERHARGVRALVGLAGGEPVGFVYVVPIELSPWGPLGEDLAVVPCLWVLPDRQKHGAGRALVEAAEAEARQAGFQGLCTVGMTGDFLFMPAAFFRRFGWEVAAERGKRQLLWKPFDASAAPPRLTPDRHWRFEPVEGRVAVDLFYNTFCQTSDVEAQRVREVAAEFGDRAVLREHPVEDRDALLTCGIERGIFIGGREIGWGYEAPREGVREAIAKALAERRIG